MKTAALAAQPIPLAPPPPTTRANSSPIAYAEARARTQEANITLTTREGDRITINQTAISRQLASARLGNNGSQASLHSFQAEGMSIAVQGDLNAQELADLSSLLDDLSTIAQDFFAGNMPEALNGAMGIGDMGSISTLEATFSRSSLLSQHLSGPHPLPALGEEGRDPLFAGLFAAPSPDGEEAQAAPSLAALWQQFLEQFPPPEPLPLPSSKRPDTAPLLPTQAGEAMLARAQQTMQNHPRLTPLLPSVAELAIDLARQRQSQGADLQRLAGQLSDSFGTAFSDWML